MDRHAPPAPAGSAGELAALYQAHAAGLIRLAMLMLGGDQSAAEDVVQDAFLGLHRRWNAVTKRDRLLTYVRSSVLNGCRDVLRKNARRDRFRFPVEPAAESAESRFLLGEEHDEVLAALRRLPDRQREAVVLRICLGMPEDEVATTMGISRGTVKSATFRGTAALAKILKEES
jgi:RNA polymerase sigma-70 factor (sigma-E family)